MQKAAVLCISREPQLLLRLPKLCYFCINLLSETTKSTPRDVMISLKKIRLHQSNAILALDFGLSESSVSTVIRRTIPNVAYSMKSLIYFPPSTDVLQNLPIPFRRRYSQVQSIIDCFEIQIEKPTNAVKQALTWSDYKSCNTLKYLISITPDGFINFISEGYGGRASDSIIFEDCGILQALPKGAAVLADRGFKNVGYLLQKHGHSLIRPPSVSAQVIPTKREIMETKKIAAIRIHVERAIGRLRTFGFLLPHACVDCEQIDLLDYIVITACGIVNLQSPLFSQDSS
ncbi:DDE superfamily endonuclease domain-containing protein [Phthorimaea operculella]|nr:DDE superfamily endonuclease domain-containing protein [Phthorimaea operculella]